MEKLFKKYSKVFLIGIFILGILLRFYQLNVNPPSLNWDEVSTGYNAYSILKTGKDEYGTFLPLSIRSFDDYKPPLYTYLTVPSIFVFGLNEFAVRFPSALLGSLTVLVVYFLVSEVLKNSKLEKSKTLISLAAAFLFATSPWSLQFSRAAYEGNIGLFFLLVGCLFLYKSVQNKSLLFLSFISFVLSMYSYHSFRLVVPLFIIGFGLIFFKEFLKDKVKVFLAGIMFIVLAIPIYSSFLLSSGGTGSRLSMVTIYGDSPALQKSIKRLEYDRQNGNVLGLIFENRRFVYGLETVKGYLDHYNPDFLFIRGDGGRQHHPVDFGMLYLVSLPFILVGIYVFVKNWSKQIFSLFLLTLLAPLASSITSGTPHPVRAIIMAPLFDVFAAVGIVIIFSMMWGIKSKVFGIRIKHILLVGCLMIFMLNLLYYFHQYYIHTPREYGDFWQYGNKEAILYAKSQEDAVDRIVMTYKYDQPYVYYLFYNKVDPVWYQKNWNFTGNGEMPRFERKIGKYEFRNINWGEDQKLHNTLFIGAPDEIPEGIAVKEIKYLDGSTAYRVVKN